MKPYFFSLLFLSWGVFADTRLFEHFSTTLQIGVLTPQYELSEYIPAGPSAGIVLSSPYTNNFETNMFYHYSNLEVKEGKHSPRNIHSHILGIALVYSSPVPWIPRSGIGFANHLIQSTKNNSSLLLMDDKESEFEVVPLIFYRLPLQKNFKGEMGVEWHMVLSEPHLSHLPRLYFGITYLWW